MPSREPSSSVPDPSEDSTSEGAAPPIDALALAEAAEAEAAEAEAVAAAARAKARAIRLRNEAAVEQHAAEQRAAADTESVSEDGEEAAQLEAVTESASGRRLPRVPARLSWKVLATCLVLIVITGLLATSGWMIWQHRQAAHRQQLIAEYTAAARQSVVTLMSLDFNHAEDDVKRILDNSTGEFRSDFESQAKDFVKLAQDAKVVTEASAKAAAVDSMTDNSAVVLVAVSTHVSNTTGANNQPRPWRVAVDLVREGDQIKLSKVEFVP